MRATLARRAAGRGGLGLCSGACLLQGVSECLRPCVMRCRGVMSAGSGRGRARGRCSVIVNNAAGKEETKGRNGGFEGKEETGGG